MQSIFDSLAIKYPNYFQERIWASQKGLDFPFPASVRKNAEKSLVIYVATMLTTNPALILDQFKALGIPAEVLDSIKTCLKEGLSRNDVGSTKFLAKLTNFYPTCVVLSVAVKQNLIDICKGKIKKLKHAEVHKTILQTYDTFLQSVIDMNHNSVIPSITTLGVEESLSGKILQDCTEVFFSEPANNMFAFIEG